MTFDDWKEPTAELRLGVHEAHVWSCVTTVSDATVEAKLAHLSGEELRRVERFRHRAGLAGFVVTRSALRGLLGGYLGVSPAEVSLRFSPTGKPVLAAEHETALRFSVAHSGGVALLSFALVDVGVDVERIRPIARLSRIARRIFTQPIPDRLANVPPADLLPAFFAAWTQREAVVKALGGTMLATSDPLDFTWPPPSSPRHFTEAGTGAERHWTIAALPQPEGFAATLVAAGRLRRIRLLRYRAGPAGGSAAG